MVDLGIVEPVLVTFKSDIWMIPGIPEKVFSLDNKNEAKEINHHTVNDDLHCTIIQYCTGKNVLVWCMF